MTTLRIFTHFKLNLNLTIYKKNGNLFCVLTIIIDLLWIKFEPYQCFL